MSKRNRRRNRNKNTVFLNSQLLERDFSYQRPVDMNKVNKILSEFDKDLVNTLKVSLRDGHYYVFDGSHTLEALRLKNGTDNFMVECKLYTGLSYEREAELFALQNGESTRVGVPYKIRALAAAGDQVTVDFITATKEAGFEVSPGNRSSKHGSILAVAKANALYKSMGRESYTRMLRLILSAWHGEPWSVSQNMLSGMALLLKTFGDKITTDRFVKKMSDVSASEVQKEASKLQNLSVSYQYAFALARLYNRGGAKGTLAIAKLNFVED